MCLQYYFLKVCLCIDWAHGSKLRFSASIIVTNDGKSSLSEAQCVVLSREPCYHNQIRPNPYYQFTKYQKLYDPFNWIVTIFKTLISLLQCHADVILPFLENLDFRSLRKGWCSTCFSTIYILDFSLNQWELGSRSAS